jgi:hypothetical protein
MQTGTWKVRVREHYKTLNGVTLSFHLCIQTSIVINEMPVDYRVTFIMVQASGQEV